MKLWQAAIIWCTIQTVIFFFFGKVEIFIEHIVAITCFVGCLYTLPNKVST